MIPFIGAALGGLAGLASGAVSLAAPAVSALGSAGAFLGTTAIGAGGSVLSGIGKLGGGIIDTAAGKVFGAGEALFGGQASVPVMTGGEMGSLSAASAGGGLFSNLSWDTIGNVASLGYQIYTSSEERKLAEKAIEAQRRAGYYVTPSAPTTALAPTTSIAIPAAAAPGQPPGLFQTEEGAKMIKYAIIAIVAYLLLKGVK